MRFGLARPSQRCAVCGVFGDLQKTCEFACFLFKGFSYKPDNAAGYFGAYVNCMGIWYSRAGKNSSIVKCMEMWFTILCMDNWNSELECLVNLLPCRVLQCRVELRNTLHSAEF